MERENEDDDALRPLAFGPDCIPPLAKALRRFSDWDFENFCMVFSPVVVAAPDLRADRSIL
jgi:hypothetical protein